MKFIDLFAGIGGFHQALSSLGHECVFASEKKEVLAELYEENYGIKPNRNILTIPIEEIPSHDILCAGFPCQPFSKAGNQEGLKDKINGNFFDKIIDILSIKQPSFFILENVRNLETHDNNNTWRYIQNRLSELNYFVDKNVMSPHHYNIPQHRERLFIVGSKKPLIHFSWPEKQNLTVTLKDILKNENALIIDSQRAHAINVWQEFVDALSKDKEIPGFPIWSMEFGATYPTDIPISRLSNEQLEEYRGNFGIPLKGMTYEMKLENLPGYAVKNKGREKYPDWKIRWINANRKLYSDNKEALTVVVDKIKRLPIKSWQKFEWNCGNVERKLSNYIIQFRASGVRIKRADFFPSLVTVSTQIPIIGWENRYLTIEEGRKIQSFETIKLPENLGAAFAALGNAVNVQLVTLIAERLLDHINKSENSELQKIVSSVEKSA